VVGVSYGWSTTVRGPSQLGKAVEEIAAESSRTEGVPDLSQSEAIRRLLEVGLEETDDLSELVSDETRILLARQSFKETEGKVRNLRTGFETRVKRTFKQRFENGYSPEQLREFGLNLREEARILWPDWFLSTLEESEAAEMRARRRECIEYVDRVVEAAVEAVETSDRDPLDPDAIFNRYEGVEDGRQRQAVEDQLDEVEQDARDLARTASSPDPDALATTLAKRHGVGRSVAEEAAVEAVAAVETGGGVSADD